MGRADERQCMVAFLSAVSQLAWGKKTGKQHAAGRNCSVGDPLIG